MRLSKGLYVPDHLRLSKNDKGCSVVAAQPIEKGEIVCELYFDSIRPKQAAASKSVQMWRNVFLNNKLKTMDNYFNHSCDPTTRINFSRYTFEALRDIATGEEITWNYLTTEYDLAGRNEDFECKCNYDNCVGAVKGFKFLAKRQQKELWPYLSTYLRTEFLGIEIPPLVTAV